MTQQFESTPGKGQVHFINPATLNKNPAFTNVVGETVLTRLLYRSCL